MVKLNTEEKAMVKLNLDLYFCCFNHATFSRQNEREYINEKACPGIQRHTKN